MTSQEKEKIEQQIIEALRLVFDPEIPVNVYDLGLIYDITVNNSGDVAIVMTLTAPGCPLADFILEDVRISIGKIAGVSSVSVHLTFEPPWHKDMMSEEAKLELGLL